MRLHFLVCLLFVALVSGQTAPPAPAPPANATQAPSTAPRATNPVPAPNAAPGAAATKAQEAPAPEVKVGPDDPVITIKGFCSDSALQGDACKTVVTRAQFEKLADALQPGMAVPMRRQLASFYASRLPMSVAAEKRGLDKQPQFDEAMRFARINVLAQELSRALQAESNNVSDQEIQDYYQKNAPNFEQATFVRIFVPRTKRVVPPPATAAKKPAAKGDPTNPAASAASKAASAAPKAKQLSPQEQEKAGEETMKKEAALLRARLVKGEDPEKLEKAAWVAAGLPGTPSSTKMEKVRRNNLPAGHQSVMDLKPGDVSEVISDASGNYIYKLVGKETLPLDTVKSEIRNQLASQRFREAMQRFQTAPDLNDAYFGPSRPPGMPMPPHGPKAPGKQEEEDRD